MTDPTFPNFRPCRHIVPLALACLSLSLLSAGEGPDGDVRLPSISDDGRFVAFRTNATNLLSYKQTSTYPNVFWMDRETRIIHNAQHVGGPTDEAYYGAASEPSISRDGEWIVFQSGNTFIPGNSGKLNIFVSAVRSVADGMAAPTKFKMISRAPDGAAGDGVSKLASISGNGRFVLYKSNATNLTADLVNGGMEYHHFLHDRDLDEDGIFDEDDPAATQTILLGGPSLLAAPADDYWPTLSYDGLRALFFAAPSNVAKYWDNGTISDTKAEPGGLTPDGEIILTTHEFYDPPTATLGTKFRYRTDGSHFGFPDSPVGVVATNGADLIFTTTTGAIVPADTNGKRDVYLINRTLSETTLISTGVGGPGNGDSGGSGFFHDRAFSISSDGRYVVFETLATNMGFVDNNGTSSNIVILDRGTGQRDRVEAQDPPTPPGENGKSPEQIALEQRAEALKAQMNKLNKNVKQLKKSIKLAKQKKQAAKLKRFKKKLKTAQKKLKATRNQLGAIPL